MTEEQQEVVRLTNAILIEGDDLPPPITNFAVSVLMGSPGSVNDPPKIGHENPQTTS